MKTEKTFMKNSSHIPIVHYEVGAVWEKESTLRFNLSGWRILGGGNQANRQVVNHSKKPPMKNIMLFFKSSLNILWFSFWQFLVFSFILYCIKSTHGKIVLYLFCTVVHKIQKIDDSTAVLASSHKIPLIMIDMVRWQQPLVTVLPW